MTTASHPYIFLCNYRYDFSNDDHRNDYTCRAPAGGGRYLTGGENIAQTWYDVRVTTADGTVRHTTEDELALGIVVTDEGKVYVTQNFC